MVGPADRHQCVDTKKTVCDTRWGVRVRTKREHIRTFNQELWIELVANADQVLPDPDIVWPAARDLKYLFYIEPWTKGDFKRRFPKAKIPKFGPGQREARPA